MLDLDRDVVVVVVVVVVGAGFGGLYALHKFRSLGLSVQVYEVGHGIGGGLGSGTAIPVRAAMSRVWPTPPRDLEQTWE